MMTWQIFGIPCPHCRCSSPFAEPLSTGQVLLLCDDCGYRWLANTIPGVVMGKKAKFEEQPRPPAPACRCGATPTRYSPEAGWYWCPGCDVLHEKAK